MEKEKLKTNSLAHSLCDEVFKALGTSPNGLVSKLFRPLFWNPTYRFSEIASGFDQIVEKFDFKEGARWILPKFVKDIEVESAEQVPKQGPLLIAANHPGTYDALIIAASVPRRDLKIIAADNQFLNKLPATQSYLISIKRDRNTTIAMIRSALSHLKSGGALLIFPSGGIDPDPACMPGAEEEIRKWSRSLVIFLRKAPQTQLLLTIVSGVLSPTFVHHLFTHFRKERRDKQRISEIFQVIQQVIAPGQMLLTPKVAFSAPITDKELGIAGDFSKLQQEIVRRAQELLCFHSRSIVPHTIR
jgi:hypothetical protein